MHNPGVSRRGNADSHPKHFAASRAVSNHEADVIARLDRATQYSTADSDQTRGRGVLDRRFRGRRRSCYP